MSTSLPNIKINVDANGRGEFWLDDMNLSDYVSNFAVISEAGNIPTVTIEILAGTVSIDAEAALKIIEQLEEIGVLQVHVSEDEE